MELITAASEALEPLGFEVLELSVSSKGRKRRVLLRIDRLDETPVSSADTQTAAEVFGLELDRLDPFAEPYLLEVESPGAERPLATERHFERFRDLLAKVRSGGESFTGRIRGVEDGTVIFETEAGRREVPLADIDRARLAEWPDTPR